jgi:hypothetical protein
MNRAWRSTTGEWLLFLEGTEELPSITFFHGPAEADLVCAVSASRDPELRRPFALRRTLLEALGGFQDLPNGVDPYRVHFGERPKFLSGIPSGVPGEDLEALWNLAWSTRHSLRTRLSGLPPTAFEEIQ